MPKILRIINRFNLGGPTFNAALLTRYLSPDYDTLLIGGKEQESEESSQFILDDLGIKPQLIAEMQRDIGIKNDRAAYLKVKQIIKEYKPDIIHTHASKAGAIGRSAGIAYGKAKMVHTFHGHVFHSYFGKFKTNVYKNIERALALKSDRIIAISEIQKLELSEKYRICTADKIAVIPLGFDLSKFNEDNENKRLNFRKKYHIADDEVAIGIIGRLVPIKNHKLFLDSIKHISDKTNQKIRVFIVGDGSESASLKKYTKEIGLNFLDELPSHNQTALIHFTSWIKDIDHVNAGMDIIALSSLNEGTPVSLIEAQASGKPVISTKVGGVSNIIRPNETGLLVNDNSVKSFSEQLIKLIEDQELRTKMGKLGWENVREKYHYTRLVNDMKSLYAEILN
ncbi:MAG: glycosyltransferase family 1 protein [Bacteroidetes bacterium]|nr:MAG: glycosyltransferase family 1 protein [Bacteroidota bacterium]MBL1145854.1 glycosyltransferase family 1 protein [Bacteroidota bacterium]MCB0802504.1 glycosyltransferase [Flavobacteriales bacterium]NOG58648.1 glycosyltransferase [Bacteroidota bacterium]